MVFRVIPGRIRREGALWAVLEALVDGEDDHLPTAAQRPRHQHPGKVGLRSGVVGRVPGENLLHTFGQGHDGSASGEKSLVARQPTLLSGSANTCQDFDVRGLYN